MASTQPQQQRWAACTACRGEGRVRRKRRRNHQNTLLDPCSVCSAAGILPEVGGESTTPQQPLRVAIIGGGIGGLALASALQHRGFVQTTVYERDECYSQRRQGYGLTMQQAAKQLAALGIVSLSDGITSTKHIVHDAEGTVLGQWGMRHWVSSEGDSTGSSSKPCESNKGKNKRQNIHIARQALRQELLQTANTMNPNIVKWSHRLIGYSVEESGVLCRFQFDGKSSDQESRVVEARVDLLVGADGIRSQVRQELLRGYPLRYLDCIVILGICPLSSLELEKNGTWAMFAHLLDGETVFQTADGTTRIYMMPFSSKEYMWQLSFPLPESVARDLSIAGSNALQQAALERCGKWHSPVAEILKATPLELVSGYPVYDRAMLTNIPPGPVTLIGDAAHPMSPFKGQGANQALLDALSLARALNKPDTTLEERLQVYSKEMIARTAVKVKASAEAARFLHSEVAIQKGNVTRGAAAAATTDRVAAHSPGVPSSESVN